MPSLGSDLNATPYKSPVRKIIGTGTDFRRAGASEGEVVNKTIECSCDSIVRTRKEPLGNQIPVVFSSFPRVLGTLR